MKLLSYYVLIFLGLSVHVQFFLVGGVVFFSLMQKEKIINKKEKIQRLGDIRPDLGKLKRKYIVINQYKWIYSNRVVLVVC